MPRFSVSQKIAAPLEEVFALFSDFHHVAGRILLGDGRGARRCDRGGERAGHHQAVAAGAHLDRLVRHDVAATAQHDARHSPDAGVTGDVKERAIDSVHGLIHLL